MLYNIHWRHDRLTFTHMKTWQEVGEQISMYTGGAAETTFTSLLSDFPYRTEDRMLYGWYYYTVYISLHHLPILNLYTTKWESSGRRLSFLTVFFNLLCLFSYAFLFITSRDKLRSIISFFFRPSQIQDLGFFGWRQTRFHLLGRYAHPIDAFETSPSVLCQSQSPSWHITQTVIHNLSFFSAKEYDEKSVILT